MFRGPRIGADQVLDAQVVVVPVIARDILGVRVLGVVQCPDDAVGRVHIGGFVHAPVPTADLDGDDQTGTGWGWLGSDAPGGRVVDELVAQGDGVERGFGGYLRFHDSSCVVPLVGVRTL